MTIRQIMSKTPANRKLASEDAVIKAVKVTRTKTGFPKILAKVKTQYTIDGTPKRAGDVKTYVAVVEVYNNKKVIISCSCQDFMYTWEEALNKRGAARIEYSNGEPPNTRNPSMVPGCCKHVYALGAYLISKGKL